MILAFLHNFQHYLVEVLPALALGLLLSGIIHEFVPQSWVNRYLSKKGVMPVFHATLAGMILPLCCFGSLPVAIGFRKKGVPLGPILAFLVSTPATSITAILVTLRLMGVGFTIYLCIAVILIGLVIGLIGNFLSFTPVHDQLETCPYCAEGNHAHHHHHEKGFKNKIISVLSFGFIDMLRHIGLELLIGLLIAAVVVSFIPLGNLIRAHLSAGLGYLFALVFGLLSYICSTASVPLVHAMLLQGMNIGAGLVLLIVGPVTSYGAILVIRKEFGMRVLLVYLSLICSLSVVLGYIYSLI